MKFFKLYILLYINIVFISCNVQEKKIKQNSQLIKDSIELKKENLLNNNKSILVEIEKDTLNIDNYSRKRNESIVEKEIILIDSSLRIKYPFVIEELRNKLLKANKRMGTSYVVEINKMTSQSLINNIQSFTIKTDNTKIKIHSISDLGLLNGIVKFENTLKNKVNISNLDIRENPQIAHRAFHIVIRGDEDIEDVKMVILKARSSFFNEIIIMVTSGVKLDKLKTDQNILNKWEKKDLINLIKFSKDLGFKVIPEIKLLTHQEKFFNNSYPKYMLNKTTYNPNNSEVYSIIFPIIDEIIEIFDTDILHIGHDEVAGFNSHISPKAILKNQTRLNPNEYIKDIHIIHNYLIKKNIKTMMWGDMFLSPLRFPSMLDKHLHGVNGFDKLINNLSKDIIIADWHYFDGQKIFPSYDYFNNLGFETYGAIWRGKNANVNFSNYIAQSKNINKRIISTTWFHLSKKREVIVELLDETGNLIWNAK